MQVADRDSIAARSAESGAGGPLSGIFGTDIRVPTGPRAPNCTLTGTSPIASSRTITGSPQPPGAAKEHCRRSDGAREFIRGVRCATSVRAGRSRQAKRSRKVIPQWLHLSPGRLRISTTASGLPPNRRSVRKQARV
jgi:hypothetical protein